MIQGDGADVRQELGRRDPLVEGLKLNTIQLANDLVSETLLPLRKECICQTLGELHIERGELSAIKCVHLLGVGLVLNDLLVYAEIVVNLPPHKLKLSDREGRLFLGDRGIVVFVINHDHARAVVLHSEVISDKVVAALVQILCFGDAVRLEYSADHGDELCKFAHTLIERVRRLEGGRQRAVVVPENVVVEEMAPDVDNLLVWDGINRARGKGEAGVHLAHIFHEIDPGGVDRIDRRQFPAVKYREYKSVVVNRKLRGHFVVKRVGRHIRVRPGL